MIVVSEDLNRARKLDVVHEFNNDEWSAWGFTLYEKGKEVAQGRSLWREPHGTLHRAVRNRCADAVRALLDGGADSNQSATVNQSVFAGPAAIPEPPAPT